MRKRPIDDLDLLILEELMKDARISNKDLAERIELSQAPTLARVNKLFSRGVIAGTSISIYYPSFGLRAKICFQLVFHKEHQSPVLEWMEENPFIYRRFNVEKPNNDTFLTMVGFCRHSSLDAAQREVMKFLKSNKGVYLSSIDEIHSDHLAPISPRRVLPLIT